MTLTLRIENYDKLPDGGPTSASVTAAGMSVGRSASMDWSLPDPQRHISSHHFDITYRDGSYYLTDVSTNGVFFDGQRHRLEGPHRLNEGDRFQVGNYFIVATMAVGLAQPPTPSQMPPPPVDDGDPWVIGGAPSAPVDVSPPPDPRAYDDFMGDFIVNPNPPPPVPAPQAAPIPAAPSPFDAPQAPQGGSESPFSDGPIPAAPAPDLAPTPPAQAPAPPADRGGDILAAFCEGAGLPAPPSGSGVDGAALARELGRTMQAAAAELMALLQDRAAAKQFTKSGDRTMMGAANNNPLKHMPNPTEALKAMFLEPQTGFMTGGEGMTAALGDVKTHQMAVFAAIQPALIKLLEDLSPEAIEEATGSGLLANSRRRAWDEYVKRWDAKVASHDNGMLDVFLKHFAESYAAAVAAARK
ncbi:type VI secretion system-associated FHA domain protein TagH [Yoonia sp. 2307UL14-13]|uniref:type VI secretion system-associated FHA domain protein TagH n=1 Tax=Yoonia sp. 2307UL14-13 TaxID=3126506 RepID=UPI003094F4FE